MNKKIFTSLIVLTNFLGFNAYAAIDENNQDTKRGFVNENVGTESPQAIIAGDGSTQTPPNTDVTTYVGVSKNASNASSFLDNLDNWGETAVGPYFCYKNPDKNSSLCMNCSSDSGKCSSVESKQLQTEAVLTVSEDATLDDDGYLTTAEPPVLFEQGGAGYEKYFYRYWNTEDGVQEGAAKEDLGNIYNWSPSLPQVCFDTFNYDTFENDVKNSAENAKNYFGNKDLELDRDERNSYEGGSKNRYSVYARVKPETFSGISSGLKSDAEFDTKLNVYAWTKKTELVGNMIKEKYCLDPNFTPTNLRTGNEGKNTYFIDNPNNLSSITLKSGDIKLPCGMFTKTTTPNGYSISALGTSCTGNNVLRERNGSGLMYTKFKVKLPSPKTDTGYETAATHDLNVRACVQCRSLSGECRELVYAVLEAAGCKGTSCTPGQLETAIKNLRTKSSFSFTSEQDKANVSTNRQDIVYSKSLTCNDGCLNQVETILKDILNVSS